MRNALWIAAVASFGFTQGQRWVTGAVLVAAIGVGWIVDKAEHPDG